MSIKSGEDQVVDGHPKPVEGEVMEGSLIFSPNGKRVAYTAYGDDGDPYVVVDGNRGQVDSVIQVVDGSLMFSANSKRVAYAAKDYTGWLVVVDGKPGPHYESIIGDSLEFCPGGVVEYLAGKNHFLFRVRHVPRL